MPSNKLAVAFKPLAPFFSFERSIVFQRVPGLGPCSVEIAALRAQEREVSRASAEADRLCQRLVGQ